MKLKIEDTVEILKLSNDFLKAYLAMNCLIDIKDIVNDPVKTDKEKIINIRKILDE